MLDAKRCTLTLYMHVHSDTDIEHYADYAYKTIKQRQTSIFLIAESLVLSICKTKPYYEW